MRDLNIIYDGIGCFDENTGIGNYHIILPIQNPGNDYEFKMYNFSSSGSNPHNRLLIHMLKKTTGTDTDYTVGCVTQPYFSTIEIDLNNLQTDSTITSLPNYAGIAKDKDIEVILYHNDSIDSNIIDWHDNEIEIPFLPSRLGFGTFKKS